MTIDRRTFIKTAGGIALGSVVANLPVHASSLPFDQPASRRLRVGVFYEPSFPSGEIKPLEKVTLQEVLHGHDVTFFSASELHDHLTLTDIDLLLNPYGSLFPKEAYNAINAFLKAGGNWVNLGGVPFSTPVVQEGNNWRMEVKQTAFHKNLGITQAFPVSVSDIHTYESTHKNNRATEQLKHCRIDEIYELYVRFTETKDFSNEDGTGGQRDATLRPLLIGNDSNNKKLAAPVIQIDRLQGDYAGGRWVLANFKGSVDADMVRRMVDIASYGAMELTAHSSFASYHEGEIPSLIFYFRRPKGNIESYVKHDCQVEVLNDKGTLLERMNVRLSGKGTLAMGYLSLSQKLRSSFTPGLYQGRVHLTVPSVDAVSSEIISFAIGFWMFDATLLATGKSFTVNANYFLRDGQLYPVTGTTYMASDVHRKFLFEANPQVWDGDFRAMKASGINMVRTGIWTGWKNVMLDVGSPNEVALRAMDAFVLTARKYDIPIIFTFFAFLPETWGGLNAYLDPRSVNAQKEFIQVFVQRYREVNDILWDFINEPSFCSPQHLWQCRPNYDTYESIAWSAWLKRRYPFPTEKERLSHLQEIYRTTTGEALDLPQLEEFADVNIFDNNRPIKVIDYHLFAQEIFTTWAKEMAAVVKSNGNSRHLVTVGQDEGGTGESPSPQFFADAVDFTCIHNWWLNDDLVWDSVVTKASGKPNLVEETGVMFYEKIDGSAWRTEQDARNLLERKLAVAVGAGGAGFIEWVWNTNPYMKSDNEAAIGLFRADGTAKPELNSVETFAKFLTANRHHMVGKRKADVLMVIPHSQQYSPRNFATDATKRCVRVMSYNFQTPVEAVSEYRLDTIQSRPSLIVLPSPRTINQHAWMTILSWVEQGSVFLVTGAIDADDHWLPVERLKQFGITTSCKPIAQEEFLTIDGVEHRLSYRGNKIQRLEKAFTLEDLQPTLSKISHGKGTILWSPLPVELSDAVEPTGILYKVALATAGITPIISLEDPNPPVLVLPIVFQETVLITCVSETDRETTVILRHTESQATLTMTVPAQRSAMMFIRRKDGRVIARI